MRTAASNWEKRVQQHFEDGGFLSRACDCSCFCHAEREVRIVVHGNDFAVAISPIWSGSGMYWLRSMSCPEQEDQKKHRGIGVVDWRAN